MPSKGQAVPWGLSAAGDAAGVAACPALCRETGESVEERAAWGTLEQVTVVEMEETRISSQGGRRALAQLFVFPFFFFLKKTTTNMHISESLRKSLLKNLNTHNTGGGLCQ